MTSHPSPSNPSHPPRGSMSSANGQHGTGLILDATGVAKTYGAVRALRDASLAVRPGEVHALMGANGAGKSTLVKILTGVIRPDSGRILVRGEARDLRSPAEARRAGLVSVYQEPALIPDLDVARQPAPDRHARGAVPRPGSRELGVPDLDLRAMVRDLPLAVLRILDLARALAIEPDVLLLDEMTAALPADLAERVLDVVGRRRETGQSVIFISHRLLEIGALCDRATVLRDGETVGVVEQMGAGAEERIVELMLGPVGDAETDIHERVVSTAAPHAAAPDATPRHRAARALRGREAHRCLLRAPRRRGPRRRRPRRPGPGRALRRPVRRHPAGPGQPPRRRPRGTLPPSRRRHRGRPRATCPATAPRPCSCSARSARTSPCRTVPDPDAGASSTWAASSASCRPPSSVSRSTPAHRARCGASPAATSRR